MILPVEGDVSPLEQVKREESLKIPSIFRRSEITFPPPKPKPLTEAELKGFNTVYILC